MSEESLIQISGLGKSYGGVQALRDVHLDIRPGEVHAICGENGAGKSTLIKVLTGVVVADAGHVAIGGQRLELGSVRASEAAGIAAIHQESIAFPDLNAVDNLFVGRERTRFAGLMLDRAAMRLQAHAVFERLGEQINLRVPLGQLPLAQRQMVAVARALLGRCRLLIMDEPTASLSARETRVLLDVVRQLRQDGVSVLYVSHRLEEIFEIADRVTVLRDGQWVATQPISLVTTDQLIHWMIGRNTRSAPADQMTAAELPDHSNEVPALHVERLTREGVFHDITFSVRAGQIVGLGGLVGAGRSEIARAVFGIDPYDSGYVEVAGHRLPPHSAGSAMTAGLALVPEDRQHEGLVLPMSVQDNISLAALRSLTRWGLVDANREVRLVDRQIADLQVRTSSRSTPAETLSGGNQQKLVLGKWLAREPRVLILDEPTRGVDVGAKEQVHAIIRGLASRGLATVVISSDMPELLALSDRIVVIREGRVAGQLARSEASAERVLALALPDSGAAATAERRSAEAGRRTEASR